MIVGINWLDCGCVMSDAVGLTGMDIDDVMSDTWD